MTKHHYVYRSFEEGGREYIGVRSCNCLPEEDTKYFGSFRDKTFRPTRKTILFVCETRKEVLEIEIELHNFFDVAANPKFANMAKQTSSGFTTQDLRHTVESKSKIGKASKERVRTPESKLKSSESNKGKKRSNTTRKRLSEATRGRKWWHNPLTRESTLSRERPGEDWKTGRPELPPQRKEANQARSEALRGRAKSDTHKENLKVAAKQRYENKGKK